MTLFLHTGPMRKQARGVLCAAVVLAALLVTSWPSWAASPADLAGPLRDIAAMDRAGRLSPADPFAKLVGVRGDGRVLVDILFTRPAAGEIGNLTRLGARLHRQSDVRAEAIVPVSRLVDVACLPNVAQVCVPDRPVPLQIGPTVSEGVQLTNALSLQVSGITGLGVSVAIIDEGFLDYDTAELPPNVVTRSFRSDGVINGISDHGTAVAEIVADMAPNVSMYLLAVGTSMDVESALQYCIQNDIDIANISLGFLAGPFDGLAALDKAVNRARLAGVLPVVSSGNFAQRHWAGDYVDADGDSLMEFASQDEGATITTTVANEQVQAYLSWFETASAQGTRADLTDRDYDIELVDPTGVIIASSAVTQNGNDPPTETLLAIAPTAGSYDLRVRAKSANISTGPTDHFQFFVWTQDLESTLQVPETSLSVPGTAAGALSVGATRAVATLPAPIMNYPVDTLEPFSSQGPTVDGRQKPEMSGPDYVQTSTSLNPFPGTSAAAPHVAGGAALLKSEDQTRTPDELVDVLVRQLAAAQNLVSPIKLIDGKNASIDEAGAGRLSLRSGLDTKPPSISITFPLNGTTITTAQPTVVGVITDTETGVDQTTIELTLDGATVQWDSFNPSSGVVTYTPPAALTRAAHTVTLVASDNAGNAGAVAVANFRVGLPTLSAGLHLISLPYRNLKDPDPASIFGIAQSEVALARWVPTDTGFSKYRLWPDRYATFEPADCTGANPTVDSPPAGLGYFVNLPREVVLNVAGESLSDVSSYTIQLPLGTAEPTGWHMIGNPYQDTVDWSTVQFITHGVRQDLDTAIANGVTGGIIYEYVPGSGATGGYYDFTTPQSAALKPMTGYWLHVLTSTAVVIYPSTVTGSKTASKQAAESPKVSLENWKLQLVASAPGLRDPCNYLGVAATASSGYDVASDVPEPPPLGQTLRLYFPHPEWKTAGGEYAQDLRARSATAQSWAFEVACPTPGQRVTLTWPDLNASVPGELAIRLKDLDSGRAAFMRTTSSYSFKAPDAGVRHFEITAERAGAGGLQITALAAAPARDGSIAVSYELSTAASVTAEVRNIVGRPIRSLVVDRSTAKGTQTLTWDTRNEAGVRVPAGTYLLQLTAKTPDGQAVRRVCPVNAVR